MYQIRLKFMLQNSSPIHAVGLSASLSDYSNTLECTVIIRVHVLRPSQPIRIMSSRSVNLLTWSWAGLGGGRVWRRCPSCTLGYWGAQLIMAYSWARPATYVAGKGRGWGGGGGYFFCFFTFILVPLSSLPLSFISSTIYFIS